jgi:hypothetical protein
MGDRNVHNKGHSRFVEIARNRLAIIWYRLAYKLARYFASEGWWARQDSNLQPDRYEREDSARFR